MLKLGRNAVNRKTSVSAAVRQFNTDLIFNYASKCFSNRATSCNHPLRGMADASAASLVGMMSRHRAGQKELSARNFGAANYALGDLRIVSELRLPGLRSCAEDDHSADPVIIRRARIPDFLSSADYEDAELQCNKDELLLDIPRVARYLLRGGKEIFVDQAADASDNDVCSYLLGTVFGVLCHQREFTPLHASVIEVEDGCVAFMGDSGAGKSTLLAALSARGHQVLADDICLLRLEKTGNIAAWPGLTRIRLWEDALVALGCDGPGIERVWLGWNKFFVPVDPPRNPSAPRRLRAVYQLHPALDEEAAAVNRLHGAAAIEAVIQNVYRLRLAEHMGHKANAFIACAAVARQTPVFRFSRPIGFAELHQGVDLLEKHFRASRMTNE